MAFMWDADEAHARDIIPFYVATRVSINDYLVSIFHVGRVTRVPINDYEVSRNDYQVSRNEQRAEVHDK